MTKRPLTKRALPLKHSFSVNTPLIHSPRRHFVLDLNGRAIHLGTQTKIMGILNLTPDSFSRDGSFVSGQNNIKKNITQALSLIQQGADIIDIGGESTRPGARSISAKEECDRILPTIRQLAKITSTPLSVDTYKTEVARHALDNGAAIINNIMGTRLNRSLLKMVKNYNASLVLMHIRGVPRTMQNRIRYRHVIPEIIDELRRSIENCLEIGIKSDKIIIDPGIGFGKTLNDNLAIIDHLADFNVLKRPLLIGTSRKSFIGKILDKDVGDRLMGTAATVAASILRGAHMVRVHDVGAIKDVVAVTDRIINHQAVL